MYAGYLTTNKATCKVESFVQVCMINLRLRASPPLPPSPLLFLFSSVFALN